MLLEKDEKKNETEEKKPREKNVKKVRNIPVKTGPAHTGDPCERVGRAIHSDCAILVRRSD